jgi:hypothetical protein
MFEQAVLASEAMQQAAGRAGGAIVPALCGCRRCGTARMIASPALGLCKNCGTGLAVLGGAASRNVDDRKPLTRAA